MAKAAVKSISAARNQPADAVQEQAEAAQKPAGKRGLLLGLVALLLLGAAGGAAAWYLTREGTAEATTPPPAAAQAPIFVNLEPFTVNLQPGGDAQYLQTTVVLKTLDPETDARFRQHMPEVKDRILILLSSKSGDELLSGEGKQKLAKDIQGAVNQPFAAGLPPQKVEGVLFTSFVIQ